MGAPKKSSARYKAFARALGKVLKVSHAEMKELLDTEKAGKKRKAKKPSASDRASGERD